MLQRRLVDDWKVSVWEQVFNLNSNPEQEGNKKSTTATTQTHAHCGKKAVAAKDTLGLEVWRRQ